MATLLTDAQVNALETTDLPYRDKQVQGGKHLPIQIDLSLAAEVTIGRAILDRINATPALATQLGVSSPMKVEEEKHILRSITYIAIVPATNCNLLAYSGATLDLELLTAGAVAYKPSVELWRNYVAGGAAGALASIGFGG